MADAHGPLALLLPQLRFRFIKNSADQLIDNEALCTVSIPTDGACVAAFGKDGRPYIVHEPDPCPDRARIIAFSAGARCVHGLCTESSEDLQNVLRGLERERLCDHFRVTAIRELRRICDQIHIESGDRRTAMHARSWVDQIAVQIVMVTP